MKIGLFFGSFNPIHNGHLVIAKNMVENSVIDRLWFVVSPQNPLKKAENLLNDNHRLKMVTLAIAGDSRLYASDIEFNLPKPSYTINTLNTLRKNYPDAEFFIIMGADNFLQLKKWKDYSILINEYHFLVYPRPGFDLSGIELAVNFTLIDLPLMDISSTFIRKEISANRDVKDLLPPEVFQYIKKWNFYKTT